MRLVRWESHRRSSVGKGILGIPSGVFEAIAADVGTPVYVYHADAIRSQYHELTDAMAGVSHQIFYSVKANSNLAVLRLVRSLGAGVDIVSGGELVRAMHAGFPPEDIVFSGVGKTGPELMAALKQGVGLINVESFGELEALNDLAGESGRIARFGIRVNPDVRTTTHPYTQTGEHGMKFGVPPDEVLDMARWAVGRRDLELRSVGMHIGSQIADPRHYREGAEKLIWVIERLRNAGVSCVRGVGVGGGLGIKYTDERALPAREFAEAIRPLAEKTGLPVALEPGRFLVGNAGYLLTRCIYRKRSGTREFVVVDAGMNDLLRPSLYGAVHDIRVVGAGRGSDGGLPAGSTIRCDVVGPICETGDFFGVDRELPDVGPGTLLVVLGTGAYGFSMSSTYNSRPRPAEVLVDGKRWAIVRERETVGDLMRGERLAGDGELQWTTSEVDRG